MMFLTKVHLLFVAVVLATTFAVVISLVSRRENGTPNNVSQVCWENKFKTNCWSRLKNRYVLKLRKIDLITKINHNDNNALRTPLQNRCLQIKTIAWIDFNHCNIIDKSVVA